MIRYWNFTDISAHTGVPSVALRQRAFRGTMPKPDAEIGSMPGWLPDTITDWWSGKEKDGAAAETLLTTAEAARALAVSERTLQAWRGKGVNKGPRWRKLGNLVRYNRDDIEAWLEGGQGA